MTKKARKSTAQPIQPPQPAELPYDDADKVEAYADSLYEKGGAMQGEAAELFKRAHALRSEQERPELTESKPSPAQALEAEADKCMEESARLYQQATRILTGHESGDADDLFAQAEALRTLAQAAYDTALDLETDKADDTVIDQAEEALIDAQKQQQTAYIKRQSWALFGQLVLLGVLQPPNMDAPDDEAADAASNLLGTLSDLEIALERINQQTITEYV